MKITLFTHNAIVGVDAPLCHKSKMYVEDLIARGEARMLPNGDFRRPAAQLLPPKGYIGAEHSNEVLIAASHEAACNTAITSAEAEANVGIAETQGAMLRAQSKIKAWMSRSTSDERAPLPRGKWVNLSTIEVTATA